MAANLTKPGGDHVPIGLPDGNVTLVQGSAFCISKRSGDISGSTVHGFMFRDTRFLSKLALSINSGAIEGLAATTPDPFTAIYVARALPENEEREEKQLLVFRYRYIGRGMREDLVIRNFSAEPAYCSIEYEIESDFAEILDLKANRIMTTGESQTEIGERELIIRHRRAATRRGIKLSFSDAVRLEEGSAVFEVIIPPRGEWSTCMQLTPIIDDVEIQPRYRCGEAVNLATPVQRLEKWRREIPTVTTNHQGLQSVIERSADDLGALRIFDPEYPERVMVAAGAPWFMTLFGRDSLLSGWMALIADPELALGVLQTLARFQGENVEPRSEEEPGRILHEMRLSDTAHLRPKIYYGSADATPLFVMLLGELQRWGLAPEIVTQLLPHADRALDWITNYGDRDGDGYVEYQRASDRGSRNQGWKDSLDGIRFENGDIAKTPIALCEVQGYVYSAFLARAHFAREAGDDKLADSYSSRANELKIAFNRDFWLEDKGWFAIGLDRDKMPIDSLTSNIGHCLWTGIIDTDKADLVAKALMSKEMFDGWGVRTLSSNMGGYNPVSYHCGSVWPHDNAIIAAGLMRYGFVEEAHRIALALISAGVGLNGRLPELFTGLSRNEFPTVVPYPASCSPQAWAAASPLLLLRMFLRLDPQVSSGKLWISPALPEEIGFLRVDRIPIAGRRVTVEVREGELNVEGIPPEIEVVKEARDPMTAV